MWLANAETGTHGGGSTWRDRAAMDACLGRDLFKGVLANPHVATVSSQDSG